MNFDPKAERVLIEFLEGELKDITAEAERVADRREASSITAPMVYQAIFNSERDRRSKGLDVASAVGTALFGIGGSGLVAIGTVRSEDRIGEVWFWSLGVLTAVGLSLAVSALARKWR